MRRLLRHFLLALWLVVSTIGLTLLWIRDPSLWAPIPQWVWEQVNRHVEIRCCEEAADVEYLVVFTAAAMTVVLATALIWIAVRGLRRCKTPVP